MSKLIIKNLCKSYDEKAVINGLNMTIEEGQTVWIKADSGAGKTTLFRILSGLEKADSGEVQFDGTVAYCFQEDRLIEDVDAVENIYAVLRKSIIKKTGKEALKENIKKHLYELGLSEADINKKVSDLSGGMKRRVALARAVCHMTMNEENFGLLLLDEPFNGLDDANKEKAFDYILKYKNNITTLIASHDLIREEAIDKCFGI